MKKKSKIALTKVQFKDVPRSLWAHFRAWCTLREITAKDKFVSMLRETIKERKTS